MRSLFAKQASPRRARSERELSTVSPVQTHRTLMETICADKKTEDRRHPPGMHPSAFDPVLTKRGQMLREMQSEKEPELFYEGRKETEERFQSTLCEQKKSVDRLQPRIRSPFVKQASPRKLDEQRKQPVPHQCRTQLYQSSPQLGQSIRAAELNNAGSAKIQQYIKATPCEEKKASQLLRQPPQNLSAMHQLLTSPRQLGERFYSNSVVVQPQRTVVEPTQPTSSKPFLHRKVPGTFDGFARATHEQQIAGIERTYGTCEQDQALAVLRTQNVKVKAPQVQAHLRDTTSARNSCPVGNSWTNSSYNTRFDSIH